MFKIKLMEKIQSKVIWRWLFFPGYLAHNRSTRWHFNQNSKLTIMEVHFDFEHTI